MSKKEDNELSDLRYRVHLQNTHAFCKSLLAERRKKYKCSQIRITALSDPCGCWHIYIDPEGLVGAYNSSNHCCKWSAMIEALDDKFSKVNKE